MHGYPFYTAKYSTVEYYYYLTAWCCFASNFKTTLRFSMSTVQDITLVHFVDQHHRAAPFCFILSRSELLHRCTPSHATRPYYLLYQPFSSNHSWKPPLLNICSSSWLSLLESSSRQVGTLLVWTKHKESQAILFLCFDNSSLIMVIPFLHVD